MKFPGKNNGRENPRHAWAPPFGETKEPAPPQAKQKRAGLTWKKKGKNASEPKKERKSGASFCLNRGAGKNFGGTKVSTPYK